MALRHNKSLITQAAEFAESVLPALEQAVGTAKEVALPLLNDAREKAAPLLADGKALAAERAATGAQRVSEAVAAATDQAAVAAPPADAAAPRRRGGRLKRLLLLGGLAALGAVLYQKLRKDATSDNWQSSYVPAPPAAPTDRDADDAAGASPDEALADAAEAPHPVTSPDAPATVVDLADVPEAPADEVAVDQVEVEEVPVEEVPVDEAEGDGTPGAHQA